MAKKFTSFLGNERPILTTMVIANTQEAVIEKMKKAINIGTDAFCFQMEGLETKYKTDSCIKEIVDCADGRPIYITNYRNGNPQLKEKPCDDELLAEQLLMALECGAKLIDIRGDMFCPCEGELTMDKDAVEKQMKFIKQVKDKGGEVLMSSHVLKFTPLEKTLQIAYAQQARGTDIVKIVTAATSEKEVIENFEITSRLGRVLDVPYLFLCGGSHRLKHRLLGPAIANSIYLTTTEYAEDFTQPPLDMAKAVLAAAGYTDLP